jgi:ribonuclease P protein component
MMNDLRFPKRVRLLNAPEFERVFAARNLVGTSSFALYGASSELGHARLGITVSRRVGDAVERNRWKRMLREAFRMSQHELPAVDFVCVVRGAAPPELPQLREMFQQAAERIAGKMKRAHGTSE